MKPQYKLDRTAFEVLTFEEADIKMNNHRDMSWQERLQLLRYLNSIAYKYVNSTEPILDKTIFSARKQTHG
jgi:hypothetical protein